LKTLSDLQESIRILLVVGVLKTLSDLQESMRILLVVGALKNLSSRKAARPGGVSAMWMSFIYIP
jgi:hypothetical protein